MISKNQLLTKYWLHLAIVIILANFVVVRIVKYFIAAQTCYTRDQVLDSTGSECLVILNAKVYAPPLDGGLHQGNNICHTDITATLPVSHLSDPSKYLKEIYLKGQICTATPTSVPTQVPTTTPEPSPTPTPAPTLVPAGQPTSTPTTQPSATPLPDPTATTLPGQPSATPVPTRKPTLIPTPTLTPTTTTSTPLLVTSPTRVIPPPRDNTRAPFAKPGTNQTRNFLIIISDLLAYLGFALVIATVVIGVLRHKESKKTTLNIVEHDFIVTQISPTQLLLDSGTGKIPGKLSSPARFSGRVHVKGTVKIGSDAKPFIEISQITPLTP